MVGLIVSHGGAVLHWSPSHEPMSAVAGRPRLSRHRPERCEHEQVQKTLNRALVALSLGWASSIALAAEPTGLKDEVAREAQAQEAKVIAWRRDIHAHPELGNQEQRTS